MQYAPLWDVWRSCFLLHWRPACCVDVSFQFTCSAWLKLNTRNFSNDSRLSRRLIKDNLWWKMAFDEWGLLREDNLWWMKTFDIRHPLTEGNLSRKHPLRKDILWWKTSFDGRRPLTEDNLWWKRTFDEYDLWWKTIFDGWRPLT